jgi:hypothetical protein
MFAGFYAFDGSIAPPAVLRGTDSMPLPRREWRVGGPGPGPRPGSGGLGAQAPGRAPR